MRLKHARAILGYHLPPFITSARAVVRAFSFGDIAAELRAANKKGSPKAPFIGSSVA
jgi:hypothetical protein